MMLGSMGEGRAVAVIKVIAGLASRWAAALHHAAGESQGGPAPLHAPGQSVLQPVCLLNDGAVIPTVI